MSQRPLERSYTIEVAEAALRRELADRGIHYDVFLTGDGVCTANCRLTDQKTGNFLASGNGKGASAAAWAGSLFEATEHFFSEFRMLPPNLITYVESSKVSTSLQGFTSLPLTILSDSPNYSIPVLSYRSVSGDRNAFYPLALACPSYIDALHRGDTSVQLDDFNYERLEHYSSNSGTAIGMNETEAIIHGLLESIERTSFSSFLVDGFLTPDRRKFRVIDVSTLPDDLISAWKQARSVSGGNITIFEMCNKFGIPAYCSWLSQDEFDIGVAGFGCSLSHPHAILRSVYEVAQVVLLSNHVYGPGWLRKEDKRIISRFQEFPLHELCARFNLGARSDQFGVEYIDYENLNHITFKTDPQEYLDKIIEIVDQHGEIAFSTVLNKLSYDITIVHTFVTGEDRFFNVRSGKIVFPQGLMH